MRVERVFHLPTPPQVTQLIRREYPTAENAQKLKNVRGEWRNMPSVGEEGGMGEFILFFPFDSFHWVTSFEFFILSSFLSLFPREKNC